jgi:hypothetical protein
MIRYLAGLCLSLVLTGSALAMIEEQADTARIITMNGKPSQCLAAVHIQYVDGERVMVHQTGFDIEPGMHSLNGRAYLDTTYCRPMMGRISKDVPDLEAEFQAGKTYYVGLDHSSRNYEDWRLVIWKVEPVDE